MHLHMRAKPIQWHSVQGWTQERSLDRESARRIYLLYAAERNAKENLHDILHDILHGIPHLRILVNVPFPTQPRFGNVATIHQDIKRDIAPVRSS